MAARRELAQLKMRETQVSSCILEHMKRRHPQLQQRPGRRESAAKALEGILDEIEELSSFKPKAGRANPTEMILEQYQRELDADREEHDKLLAKMQESMPEHQQVLTLLRDREEKAKQISRMEDRLTEFGIVKQRLVNSDCVQHPGQRGRADRADQAEPADADRRWACSRASGLGIGLVCLLEHIDHSVKVPEHVTHGLTLPLLGVVPRIRRTALTHRGGHLWTPGTPDSIEADAYRNVRASLLGVADKRGPIVTLLVTSAKAGEGKSTTALNLAATCARAGERTLLLDVDLRRPSLADVFIEPDSAIGGPRAGRRPPRRAALAANGPPHRDPQPRLHPDRRHPRHSDRDPGDARAAAVADGTRTPLRPRDPRRARPCWAWPTAGCLGRIVDASLLVVRSGSHHLMTLHRAKAMLEQSHVAIAGVVFNGLTDDMNNWSSYGYDPLPLGGGRPRAMSQLIPNRWHWRRAM